MRQFIRHRQGVIHAISPNNGNTRFLKNAHFARGGGIVGALYNYEENEAQPPAGSIYHSTGLNALKINVVDANGVNHQSGIQALRAGDKITIGTQSAYITATPGITSGVALVFVDSWPNYTNGQYLVSIEKGVLPYTTVAPVISGSNLIGSTLTVAPGTWAGKPTPTTIVRQWKADGVNISGETGLTYVIAAGYAGKNISCVETGTSLTGVGSSSSNQIFAGITPTNITAPTVAGEGTPDEVLTCGNGTWEADPAATYTKQWRRDGSNISGQTADTYTVLAGDVGKIITCAVTAVNSIAGVTAISNGILVTAAVGNPPVNTSAPAISGTGQVGSILSLTSQGTWTGTPPITYTYQWQRDGANTGNTGNSYVVQAGDAGHALTCRVTATNTDGVTNASSNVIGIPAYTFSPADLFTSGEQGAFYDPSDLSTMFQDSVGTTPVTADGQPVGLILDKSGRGNHASQATAAKRPLYKTSGGLHWLQFDGVDDSLSTAAIDFTATDKMSVFSGSRQDAVGSGGIVCSYLNSPGFATLFNNNILRSDLKDVARISGATPINTDYVFSTLFDASQATALTQTKPRINRVAVNTVVDATTATGNQGTYNLQMGTWIDVVFLNGRIYSAIVLGRLATTQEITDTETWVNSKTGAY